MNAIDEEVFVYAGEGGDSPPQNVVRVRVDPSVTSIPACAFNQRKKLTEVELCEGLVEIGEGSFGYCEHSITKINTPNSLRGICGHAFSYSLRCPIHFHDGIESIGDAAFANCIFTNFRVPPLITVIPESMIVNCRPTFSVELSENVTVIGKYALASCYCLRNVAFPPDAIFGNNIFIIAGIRTDTDTDLYQLFGSAHE
jgi:hypothetical protein